MTRIAKGRQSGELWDRVKLENGLVGYVFQNYVEKVQDIEVTKVNISLENTTLQKNARVDLKVEVLPQNATNKQLTYTSSNSNVVSVNSNGRLFAVSSGTATITAKSNNNREGSIQVTVYSKVTGMQLKEDELCMQIGENYTVTPIIMPQDASNPKVNFYSSNEKIAMIDENGNIKAIAEGSVKIIAQTQEGEFKQEIALTVIPKLEEGAIIFEDELKINGNQITGVKEKTTVEQILQKISTAYHIEIQNGNGEKLNNEDYVGTQSKIRIYDEERLIIEYRIIIYGDLNGDGKINSIDLLILQRHLLEIQPLSGLYLKAANTDKSGRRPSSIDLLRMQRHILEIKEIEQL